ncbi:hypothetical protein K432DRAFT_82002 [Lepidopterella palustris CBS 459.81]|uniref:Uncharacterized protein n=1 Tax=Lepidopterella palustris CBS 459.81 TaxID=1314670 RepID=A0A8E2EJ38_9PEZI|nr:hypothetical protein K432DRAFT_82002 [Lepidopterella palustris CBS 459.81]
MWHYPDLKTARCGTRRILKPWWGAARFKSNCMVSSKTMIAAADVFVYLSLHVHAQYAFVFIV